MPDYGWKFAVIFFALFAGVVVIYRGWPPKLGIDLGGGAILVYRVDPNAVEWRPEKLDSLVRAITDRVNPGGQKEISVRSLGDSMVQIIMPTISGATAKDKQAQMDEIKRIISKTGALEFRIVATRRIRPIAHRNRSRGPQGGLGESARPQQQRRPRLSRSQDGQEGNRRVVPRPRQAGRDREDPSRPVAHSRHHRTFRRQRRKRQR